MLDILIANCRIPSRSPEFAVASVGIKDGKIVGLYADADQPAQRRIEADGRPLIPGLIDPHVHWGYHPDDCRTETRSAALNGVTTVLRFHRQSFEYSDEHLAEQIAEVERDAYCNVAYHLTVMLGEQVDRMPAYAADWGIPSFKMITGYRGYEFLNVVENDDAFILRALRQVASVPGGVACLHCENTDLVEAATAEVKASGRQDLAAWNDARPAYAEGEAILRMAYLARLAGCPLYIVHLTSSDAVDALREARKLGIQVWGETCAHYLTRTDDAPVHAKVAPPLRKAADVEALWAAVFDGTIDTIGTDHSPRSRSEKVAPTMWDTIIGNVGVGTLLPVLLSEGVNKRGLPLSRLVELTSSNPAQIFHLPTKGRIEVGADADLNLIDLDRERTVDPAEQASMSDYSLYEGWRLRGWPVLTIINGRIAAEDGELKAERGSGRFIRRFSPGAASLRS